MATTDLLELLPKYQRIKEVLRAELSLLPTGSRLPTVRDLRERFQTTQVTLDRALRELEQEGLIRREHGRGMFATPAASPPRTLTLGGVYREEPLEARLTTHAIQRFERSEQNTRVIVPSDGATVPDVHHVNTLSFLDRAGELLPLDERLPAGYLQRFDPRALSLFQRNGRTLALPRLFCPWVLYYNCEPFDRAGLPYPTWEWTWSDLREATRRLTRRSEGCYGYLALAKFRTRLHYIWQNGAELFDAATGACLLTADAVVEALEFWRELEQTSPVERETQDLNELYARFLSGRLAMFPWAGWLRTLAVADPRCRWGVVPLPAGRRRATLLVAEAYGVARATADPEAALRLALALVSPETEAEQAAAGYHLVANRMIQAQFPVEPAFEASLEWARVSREYRYRDVMQVIENEFYRAWEENAEIPATCRRVQAIVSALIDSRAAGTDHAELY